MALIQGTKELSECVAPAFGVAATNPITEHNHPVPNDVRLPGTGLLVGEDMDVPLVSQSNARPPFGPFGTTERPWPFYELFIFLKRPLPFGMERRLVKMVALLCLYACRSSFRTTAQW
jgi:hypothetical protein